MALVEAAVVAGPPICHLDVFERLIGVYAKIQRIHEISQDKLTTATGKWLARDVAGALSSAMCLRFLGRP